jgi:hypothetical protein
MFLMGDGAAAHYYLIRGRNGRTPDTYDEVKIAGNRLQETNQGGEEKSGTASHANRVNDEIGNGKRTQRSKAKRRSERAKKRKRNNQANALSLDKNPCRTKKTRSVPNGRQEEEQTGGHQCRDTEAVQVMRKQTSQRNQPNPRQKDIRAAFISKGKKQHMPSKSTQEDQQIRENVDKQAEQEHKHAEPPQQDT